MPPRKSKTPGSKRKGGSSKNQTRGRLLIFCCFPIRKKWLVRNQYYVSIVMLNAAYIFFIAAVVLVNQFTPSSPLPPK